MKETKLCRNCKYFTGHEDYLTVGKCNNRNIKTVSKDGICAGFYSPKEFKITLRQVEILYNLFCNSLTHQPCAETGKQDLKDWFPEVFKPKQEFCCDWFRERVEYGYVKINPGPIWFVNLRRSTEYGYAEVVYCLNCGERPRPPIKEDS